MMKRLERFVVMGLLALVGGWSAQPAFAVRARGGNATNDIGGYRFHVFTNSAAAGELLVAVGGNMEVLAVGGGGGGGCGGGGAGGVVLTNLGVLSSNYVVTVGAGGLGRAGSAAGGGDNWRTYAGYDGSSSVFGPVTAIGGGGGGAYGDEGAVNRNGRAGGSGGGGGGLFTAQTSAPGGSSIQVGGYGTSGGASSSTVNGGAGGGGGAVTAGGSGSGGTPGNGGAGTNLTGWLLGLALGDAGSFAGGGGGGEILGSSQATGGSGGGGNGGYNATLSTAGKPNTGGGGGGGSVGPSPSYTGYASAPGGSGIVVVKYSIDTSLYAWALEPVAGSTNATLNGLVESTGGAENPHLQFAWDYEDKSTNALGNWLHQEYMGTNWGAGEAFSTNITGLVSGSNYVYRCYATNSTGSSWSGPQSFVAIGPPTVTNLAVQARRTWARLSGQVLATGGETPTCRFAWWQNGSATTNTVSMGTQSGVFSTELPTLAPGTTYGCLVTASNGAGTATSEPGSFTTLGSGPIAWYAATNGTDGAWTNWTTAGTNLQAILDNAASNDTIYVAGHTFGLTTQLVWTTSHVTVRGGYAATNAADHPGPSDPALWPTVIQRASGNTRLLYVNGVTNGTLDQVTITGGNVGNGVGIRIDNSVNILIANCTITNNSYIVDDWAPSGGGLYAAVGTSVTISNCTIRGNRLDTSKTSGGALSQGGGIYSAGALTVRDSVICGNQALASGWGSGYGGGIRFAGTRLDLRNVLVANNGSKNTGDGLQVDAGTVTLTNVTVAGNLGEGLRRAAGTVTVKDSILWGNGVDSAGGVTLAWSCYSNSTDHVDGGDNMTLDPLFVDTTYYHLPSRNGHYAGGYFDGGVWDRSSANSPCLDAGDPATDYSREPQPNGRRVNMGCYGNSPVASKTATAQGTVVCVR
jgi:hypothetical protein